MAANVSNLRTHEGRLRTFKKSWPFSSKSSSLSPHEMAKAGFYFIRRDVVKCYYCEKELEGWEEGENVHDEHKSHAPYCPFVKKFPSPPNVVTVHQALEMDRDKILLRVNKNFEAWKAEYESEWKTKIAKLSKTANKDEE